ncbi:leucyl aminopeptidase [Lipingzhangella halophila]|uniref:Probable cytosol aminopeptidase n=1 Tax=Lipingzhangella halophila TaxID=1783352 RepID=A0A7W7RD89_9ACTN|nr:leucyl aminopeptidase [Lipingzhangella halophila]MBB4929872.1 leucyl aminopeptidase [Lipingzhangella halophila]
MPIATEIHAIPGPLVDSSADLLALPVRSTEDGPVVVTAGTGPEADALDARLPAPLAELVAHYGLKGKPGEKADFPADLGRGLVQLSFLGVGSGTPADLRKAGASFARLAKGRTRAATTVGFLDDGRAEDGLTAFIEGALLGGYQFTMRSSAKPPEPVPAIELVAEHPERMPVQRGTALANATALARDLTNTPSSRKDPEWLVSRAGAIAGEAGLDISVWNERELERDGFGAILGVGGGSVRPPRLVRLDYTPEGPESGHVVLIGKGITFDTGGLSLKPNDNMKLMKTDMSGSAVVLGVLSALGALGTRTRVTGLLALAENAFSGSAQRPSDVVTTYGGRTVEVLNTDAEGRLVLADAMDYAAAELKPDALVDVATLTGAAKVALGTGTGALFSTDDALAAALTEAAEASGEPLWRMPLVEEYRDTLDSTVADLANIGTRSKDYGSPGATDAAMFLREFTAGLPWAHLDIAGPGRSTSDEGLLTKGGTGFATRSLLRWLAG